MITLNEPIEFIRIFTNKKKKSEKTDNIDIPLNLTFDLNTLNQQLLKHNLKQETNNLIVEKFNNIKKNTKPNTFCLKCTQCNETFILPAGILSTTKLKKNNTMIGIENVDEIVTDYTLPRTKDFICPNKDCSKDDLKKEAIIYRPNPLEFVTQYICSSCKTIF
jgi:hypothetical protein